ncbi:glycerophosphoryl diester phosphodiesterase [Hoeflea marina]|uniref:Glycerophosphoryl diester phosphodiesterase n=1 Tax=Hoeflea marina TaxID=274592 RepID=A0A317PS85_9HYPH|nr:glycerophosphodiester phosphodiesterase family protein [Hoeflea marina]PWW03595.1 glycerophosphoryl diester phosphodiesterase [Hoeflea marina]
MRKRSKLLIGLALVAAAVWANNTSLLAPSIDGETRLLAHRGVHQDFDRTGLTNETCTAERILPPVAPEIENTIASMRAAFEMGAGVVELDVHPTTDGGFAVFHDWTLDCRTNGSGKTRDHDMAYLTSLDIGYGYTFDGGRTFPLRGKGVGLMPTLAEVMREFPDGRFLVNFKSRDEEEGRRFAELMEANPSWRPAIWGVYGGEEPTAVAVELMPDMIGVTPKSAKSCLAGYLALGWSGYVPAACRRAIVLVPIDVAPWLWGWPDRFTARMHRAGSEVVLRGPIAGEAAGDGIDTQQLAARVPPGFAGLVWTNNIAAVRPTLDAMR